MHQNLSFTSTGPHEITVRRQRAAFSSLRIRPDGFPSRHLILQPALATERLRDCFDCFPCSFRHIASRATLLLSYHFAAPKPNLAIRFSSSIFLSFEITPSLYRICVKYQNHNSFLTFSFSCSFTRTTSLHRKPHWSSGYRSF